MCIVHIYIYTYVIEQFVCLYKTKSKKRIYDDLYYIIYIYIYIDYDSDISLHHIVLLLYLSQSWQKLQLVNIV